MHYIKIHFRKYDNLTGKIRIELGKNSSADTMKTNGPRGKGWVS